jgi:RNA polymerase sigma-70 factor, ECF subfamily
VSQAAWARGWERIHDLRDESAASSWVNMIALNIQRRSQWRERFIQPLEEMQSSVTVDVVAIDAGRILSFCRPSERALLEHQLKGLSVKEVARAAGVTSTAIRIRLHRARRAVRARIEQRAARFRGVIAIGSSIAL